MNIRKLTRNERAEVKRELEKALAAMPRSGDIRALARAYVRATTNAIVGVLIRRTIAEFLKSRRKR